MRKFYFYLLSLITLFCFTIGSVTAQNVSIAIQAENAGIVHVGSSIFLKIYVGNTSASLTVGSYKLRPLFFIPSIISVAAEGHVLPTGWTFLSAEAGSFRLSNGTGTLPPAQQREILIKINGVTAGGPSVVQANMQFSNGSAPGSAIGPPTSSNNSADDAASVNIQVLSALPVTLTEFNANMVNCQALLKWTTNTEQNSDRFDIEKSIDNTGHWTSLGSVKAAGNSFRELDYSFIDKTPSSSSSKIFYRLKTIDLDGSYRYSQVILLQNNCLLTQIMAFPNPVVNGRMFVNMKSITGNTESTFLNYAGQVVKKQILVSGLNTLNLQGIPTGIYLMKITNDSGIIHTSKVVVQ